MIFNTNVEEIAWNRATTITSISVWDKKPPITSAFPLLFYPKVCDGVVGIIRVGDVITVRKYYFSHGDNVRKVLSLDPNTIGSLALQDNFEYIYDVNVGMLVTQPCFYSSIPPVGAAFVLSFSKAENQIYVWGGTMTMAILAAMNTSATYLTSPQKEFTPAGKRFISIWAAERFGFELDDKSVCALLDGEYAFPKNTSKTKVNLPKKESITSLINMSIGLNLLEAVEKEPKIFEDDTMEIKMSELADFDVYLLLDDPDMDVVIDIDVAGFEHIHSARIVERILRVVYYPMGKSRIESFCSFIQWKPTSPVESIPLSV